MSTIDAEEEKLLRAFYAKWFPLHSQVGEIEAPRRAADAEITSDSPSSYYRDVPKAGDYIHRFAPDTIAVGLCELWGAERGSPEEDLATDLQVLALSLKDRSAEIDEVSTSLYVLY